jgi:uncharacterized protein (TIGR01244 family)
MKNEAVINGIVVGGQPDAADVRSGRFTCVINCRPDDEEGNVTAELVKGTDIVYASVPFTGDTMSRSHIERIRKVLDSATGTTMMHCNGGTRAAVAAAIITAEREGKGVQAVYDALAAAGFDIKGRPYEAFVREYFKTV